MKKPGEEVLYTVENRVATLTINRPEVRNALNGAVISALGSFLDKAAGDKGVGSIVLTGAGGRAFCAGADLSESFSGSVSFIEMHDRRAEFAGLLLKMNRCRKPIVAAVQGYCLAAGVGLCLSCDIVIASRESSFGLPEIKRGLWPYIVTAVLVRNVGMKKAFELCATGERISAEEAERIGMINYSVPDSEFRQRVDQVAKRLASFSPVVMGLGKSSFYRMADMDFEEALEYLRCQLSLNIQCEDLKEGIAAFMERRDPRWKGR